MFHYLYCKALAFQREIADRLFFTKLYEARVGIKYVLPIYDPTFSSNGDLFYLESDELFLDFDALKDKYTLCDIPVNKSPHLGLMMALENKDDIRKTDYINRFENGILDIRTPRNVSKTDLVRFKDKFVSRKAEVQDCSYKPVAVYKVSGKYYIADGKHRAAMCAMLKMPVKCVVVDCNYLSDSFNQWIFQKMKKHPELYKKNIAFFERINNN